MHNAAQMSGIIVNTDTVNIGALERHSFEHIMQWLDRLRQSIEEE
jgi:hypothetical protein